MLLSFLMLAFISNCFTLCRTSLKQFDVHHRTNWKMLWAIWALPNIVGCSIGTLGTLHNCVSNMYEKFIRNKGNLKSLYSGRRKRLEMRAYYMCTASAIMAFLHKCALMWNRLLFVFHQIWRKQFSFVCLWYLFCINFSSSIDEQMLLLNYLLPRWGEWLIEKSHSSHTAKMER